MMLCLLIFCVFVLAFSESSDDLDWTKPGKCKHVWRHARLLGRCFGLVPFKEFQPILTNVTIASPEDCRAVCCNLGEKCVSWQYFSNPADPTIKECKLTDKNIRLGLEVTGTPEWCDPHPPSKWNGKRLKTRIGSTCDWGDDLPSQCFGLGPERMSAANTALNTEACAQACCNDPDCEMWQEVPGRGCYFANSKGIFCDKDPGVYDGGRKCIKNFCDGREAEALGK